MSTLFLAAALIALVWFSALRLLRRRAGEEPLSVLLVLSFAATAALLSAAGLMLAFGGVLTLSSLSAAAIAGGALLLLLSGGGEPPSGEADRPEGCPFLTDRLPLVLLVVTALFFYFRPAGSIGGAAFLYCCNPHGLK